ncbi:aminotransferase class III-fold pyridoxal phosphate-dependent enzyme [bacterium]
MKFGFIAHPTSIPLKRHVKLIDFLDRITNEQDIGYSKEQWEHKNLVPFLNIDSVVSQTGASCSGIVHYMPLTAEEMLAIGKKMPARVIKGIESLQNKGAEIVGLGGFTGIIGKRGLNIKENSQIPVTTGNSLTAYSAYMVTVKILKKLNLSPEQTSIAIIGYPGSICLVIAKLLLKLGCPLTLIHRTSEKNANKNLEYINKKHHSQIKLSSDIQDAYKNNKIFISATSSGSIIDTKKLLPGSIVIDVALPRDVIKLNKFRNDILLLDGGLVSASNKVKFGSETLNMSPKKFINGCLSETIVLALENISECFSIGRELDEQKVLKIGELAEKHGFSPFPLASYGNKVDMSIFSELKHVHSKKPKKFSLTNIKEESFNEITYNRFKKHINPFLAEFYKLNHIDHVFTKAYKCCLTDNSGNEYLDMTAGYGCLNLGHNHPKIIKRIKEFLDNSFPNFNQYVSIPVHTSLLAEKLCTTMPGNLERVFFSNSGAEAVEAALKLIRAGTDKKTILYADNSFHGKTMGALSITGREKHRKAFTPLLPGVKSVPFDDIDSIKNEINNGDVSAVILEPIQGEGGVIIPKHGYLKEVEQLCKNTDTLLVLDEIQTGFGRTGKMFAYVWENIEPDVVILAKSLSGGLIPIGATLCTQKVWDKAYGTGYRFAFHTSTFGGGNLAATAGLAVLEIMEKDNICSNALEIGTFLKNELSVIAEKFPFIHEVRGKGLMIAIEFNQAFKESIRASFEEISFRLPGNVRNFYKFLSDDTKNHFLNGIDLLEKSIEEIFVTKFVTKLAKDHKILTFIMANTNTVMRIQPPLIITKEQAQYFVNSFENVCKDMSTFLD